MRRFAFGLVLLAGTACLPNPQSVAERRESFDRDDLKGELLFDSPPPNMKPVGALFGGRLELVGVSSDPETPKPGDRTTITFYWRAKSVVAEDYQVFVHGDAIGGNSGRLHGDHFPAKGKYPPDVYTRLYKDKYRVPLTDGGQRPKGSDNRSLAIEFTF